MRTHTCIANGCTLDIPVRMLMCKRHWMMLPRTYRSRVWDAYQPGQEVNPRSISPAYSDAVRAAQEWLADNEVPAGA